MYFESFSTEESQDQVIIQKYKNRVKGGFLAIDNGKERLFRKPEILDMPVIGKDLNGRYYAEKAKALSGLIAHYAGTFRVRRVYVAPANRSKAQTFREDLSSVSRKKNSA